MPPATDYGAPTQDFSMPPATDYGAPTQDFSMPPATDYGAPPQDFSMPATDYGMAAAPAEEWTVPSTEEPAQLSQIYPSDTFTEPAPQPPPMPAYPPDPNAVIGQPMIPMVEHSTGVPEVQDPFATSFEDPAPAAMDPFAVQPVADPFGGGFAAPAPATDDPFMSAPDPNAMDPFAVTPIDDPFSGGFGPPSPDSFVPGFVEPTPGGFPETPPTTFEVPPGLDPFAIQPAPELAPNLYTPPTPESMSAPAAQVPLADMGGFAVPPGPDYGDFSVPAADAAGDSTVWGNLQSPDTAAGQQFPEHAGASAEFLTSVNEHLYPEDPLSLDAATLDQSGQAFAEASHLLFPETASAPLEWGETPSTDLNPDSFNVPVTELNLPSEPPPMELGPSFQSESTALNDLSDSYQPPAELTDYSAVQPYPAESELWGGETQPATDPYAGSAVYELPDPPVEPHPYAEPAVDPFGTQSYELPDTPVEVHPYAEPAADPFATQAYELPDVPVEVHPYAEPAADPFATQAYELPDVPVEVHPYAEPVADPFATQAYDLPDTPVAPHPYAEPVVDPFATQSYELPDTPVAPHPYAEPEALAEAFDAAPVLDLDVPMEIAGPHPYAEEIPVPSYELDMTPPIENVIPLQPAPAAPPPTGGLEMDHLQILGFCALDADKRLLMVESNGKFALMGQAGESQNASISRIKEFPYNPLQYQNTFTAVRETSAGGQGMYVVQVGTWHAIVTTLNNQVALHTELG